jgi:hypothetical protein
MIRSHSAIDPETHGTAGLHPRSSAVIQDVLTCQCSSRLKSDLPVHRSSNRAVGFPCRDDVETILGEQEAKRHMSESASPAPDEWDQLVINVGKLTIATGYLEMAIIAMVCRILGKSESELSIWSNDRWCKKLKAVCPTSWSDSEKADLSRQLDDIRKLYKQRSSLIHTALATVSDGSIQGIPPGSIVDLKTVGIGFTQLDSNTWSIGTIGKRVHLHEIEELTDAIVKVRVELAPFLELVDAIKHPAKPFPKPEHGKLLS